MKPEHIDLKAWLQFSPETGRLMLGNERLLLFRQEAFAALRQLLFQQLGDATARGVLAQFGYACGRDDYEHVLRQYEWDSELDGFAAGPMMHMWEGIVHVTLLHFEMDRAAGRFEIRAEWRNSYEAEIHLAKRGPSTEPVCHTLTGYASGHGTAFFGAPVLAIETACVAKGDPVCVVRSMPRAAWGAEADGWRAALETSDVGLARQLELRLAQLESYRDLLDQLGTPILHLWDHVVAMPLIGRLDAGLGERLMLRLADALASSSTQYVLLDLTGIDTMDATAAGLLVRAAHLARLMGSVCLVTGVRPDVARVVVESGVDVSELTMAGSLQEGLSIALRGLGLGITQA